MNAPQFVYLMMIWDEVWASSAFQKLQCLIFPSDKNLDIKYFSMKLSSLWNSLLQESFLHHLFSLLMNRVIDPFVYPWSNLSTFGFLCLFLPPCLKLQQLHFLTTISFSLDLYVALILIRKPFVSAQKSEGHQSFSKSRSAKREGHWTAKIHSKN